MKGLIIKDKIPQMMKGYPTVSDKYNVAGGIVSGNLPLNFGDLVAYSATPGYYVKAVGTSLPAAGLAGLVVATNVKLVRQYANGNSTNAETLVGEAFNLLLDGYIAAEVTITADTYTNIAAGKSVYYKLGASATDPIVLADSSVGTAALTGYVFTGIYDVIDSTHVLAEIKVK